MRVTLVSPLANTKVTPNHLTTMRLTAGLAAAACLAVGEQPWRDVGAALFVVSVLLDRADGDLARMTGKTTPWGHTYDLISDALCNALIFVGLGMGLGGGALGMVAGTAVAVILWLVMLMEGMEGQGAAELKSVGGFDADDGILLVPIAIWLGWSQQLLVAAATVTPVVALAFLGMYMKKRK